MTELVMTRLARQRVCGVRVPRVGQIRGARRARSAADFLDAHVDRELEQVATLPVHRRQRPVEVLRLLVALAGMYRAYAGGQIDREQLRAYEQQSHRRLTDLRQADRHGE